MLPTDTQNVVYVGKKKVKRDTVAGTGLVWCGFGDTHRVPHSSAVRLFRHPDVWVSEKVFAEAHKDDSDAPDIAPVITSEGVVLVPAQGLSNAAPAPEEQQQQEQADIEDPDSEEADGTGVDLGVVKAAILSLEHGNEKHFSPKGKPLLDAVREAAGNASISVKDVNAAFAELSKAG